MTLQNDKFMTFEQCCKVWNACQRQTAKTAILMKDRAKTSLTRLELLNKWAQMGNKVVYKQAYFTFDQDFGMGLFVTPQRAILGATIYDLIDYARKDGFTGEI